MMTITKKYSNNDNNSNNNDITKVPQVLKHNHIATKFINVLAALHHRGRAMSTPQKHHTHTSTTDSSDDSFDFSALAVKIKTTYKKVMTPGSTQQTVASFIWVCMLIAIIAFVAVSFRMGGYTQEITQEWAQNTVHQGIRQQIASEVRQQFPTLPQAEIDRRSQATLEEFLADPSQKAQVDERIALVAEHFSSQMKDDRGHPYLIGIDPYFFYRYTRNYITNGHTGEFLNDNGVPSTRFVLAPSVTATPFDFHIWFQATVFRILKPILGLTIDDLPLTLYFSPIIFMVLSAVIAFAMGRILSGNLAGFISAVFVAIHPAILARTTGGFADTDPYNIFFPLLISLLVLLALRSRTWPWAVGWSLLAGVTLRIYAFAWVGYLFIVYILFAMLGTGLLISVVLHMLRKKEYSLSKLWKTFKIPVVASGVFGLCVVVVMTWLGELTRLFTFILKSEGEFAVLKKTTHYMLWPNIYTTVAELNPASFNQVIMSLGGPLLVFLSILGFVVFAVHHYLKKEDASNKYFSLYVLLLGIIWFGAITYASFKGVRFIMIIAPIFSIGLGLLAGSVTNYFTDLARRSKDFNHVIVNVVLSALFLLLIVLPVFQVSATDSDSLLRRAELINKNAVPTDMNDAWYGTLKKIENESQTDAIISSWWDFGHHFITIANRGVTADGGSQNTPQVHWLGRILVEHDEQKALGILRMLNCDSNKAFDKLIVLNGNDMLATISLMESIFGKTSSEAREILAAQGYGEQAVDDVMASMYCTPPESFMITSADMVSKAGVWSHFGLWDFQKAYFWQYARSQPLNAALVEFQKFNMTEAQARSLYNRLRSMSESDGNQYISPYSGYYTPTPITCSLRNQTYSCPVGMVTSRSTQGDIVIETIEITDGDIVLRVGQYLGGSRVGTMDAKPTGLVILDDEGYTYQTYEDGQVFDVTFDPSSLRAVLSPSEMSRSVFTRLFFFDGQGAPYFTKFDDVTSHVGQRIITYKADWDAYLATYG